MGIRNIIMIFAKNTMLEISWSHH